MLARKGAVVQLSRTRRHDELLSGFRHRVPRNHSLSFAADFAPPAAHVRTFFWREPPEKRKLVGIDGLEGPRDFQRLTVDAVEVARRELQDVGEKDPLDLVLSLDNASNELCRIADAAELVRSVHPDEAHVSEANEVVNSVSSFMGEVNLDVSLYDSLKRAEGSDDFASLSLEAREVLGHMRVSMESEGVHLPDDEKAECLQLLGREQELAFSIVQGQEQRRGQGSCDGVWLSTEAVKEAFGASVSQLPRRSSPADEVRLPTEPRWVQHVLRHASCSKTRRAAYESLESREDPGEQGLVELLRVRQRLASLRGYGSWNEYAQRESLFTHPDSVRTFLTAAWKRLRPGLQLDLQQLSTEKEKLFGESVLEPWDVPLLLHRCRGEHALPTAELAPYMSYGSLIHGVEMILSRTLGLRFQLEKPDAGEVWHPTVQKYTVRDGDAVLGVLYLDPFTRPGKLIQSAQFTLRGSKVLRGGDRQVPSTAIVFTLPGTEGLSMTAMVTFMHEIGHALHSLLSETSMQHLSGTRGAVDFVEFPSHLFEHFVLDPKAFSSFAVHAKNGEAMTAGAIEALHGNSTSNFAHIDAVQQLIYATVDQAFYSCLTPGSAGPSGSDAALQLDRDVRLVREEVSQAFAAFDGELDGPFEAPLSKVLGVSSISRFDHLVHYGGSYYCYLFNRALSAHVWRHSFERAPFDSESGARLRDFFRNGSVIQSLEAIERICPEAGGFQAMNVPLDAFVQQLQTGWQRRVKDK